MTKRTAPYRHTDGSTCWTKNCSRGNLAGGSDFGQVPADFFAATTEPDAADLAYLRSLLSEEGDLPAYEPAPPSAAELVGQQPIHVESGATLNTRYAFRNRLREAYDPARHTPVRNPGTDICWVKPLGGFWLSTLAENGVSSWDNFMGNEDVKSVEHTVRFTPDAKVLVIDTREDYLAALDAYPHRAELNVPAEMLDWFPQSAISQLRADGTAKRGLHWEQLAQDYDAVLLTRSGLSRCGGGDFTGQQHPDDISLYIWDIESAIVFHPEAIVVN